MFILYFIYSPNYLTFGLFWVCYSFVKLYILFFSLGYFGYININKRLKCGAGS